MTFIFDRMIQKPAKAAIQTSFIRFSMIWIISAHKRAGMGSNVQWLWRRHWGKLPLSCPSPLQLLWKRFTDHKMWLLLYFSGWRNSLEKFSSRWLFSENPVEPADPSTFSQSDSVFTPKMKHISIDSDQSGQRSVQWELTAVNKSKSWMWEHWLTAWWQLQVLDFIHNLFACVTLKTNKHHLRCRKINCKPSVQTISHKLWAEKSQNWIKMDEI